MARRHALAMCLLALGAGHVGVPTALIVRSEGLTGLSVSVPIDPRLMWAGLIALAGLPLIALSLRPRHRAFSRVILARSAAAMLLLGAASATAGLHLGGLLQPGLGDLRLLAAAPGVASAVVGVAFMPILAGLRERRGGPPSARPALPDLGPALGIYVAIDWLMLRLCGLALAGIAWAIYDAGPDALAPLLYGQDPRYAMIAYGIVGASLAVPVALPQALIRPRTVLGGAAKAALLVAITALLLPAIEVATVLYVPQEHRVAVLGAAPTVFKGLAGCLVLSTIVIAFFRQLSGPREQFDGMGRPIMRFEADDLRALRASRMQG